ncbi:phosphopantothenoylcysteine decarboxylase subunit SIS2-like [Cynara cardunculus var. scolymus]|uniref:phosphopantothenoylcysteine decarboxylase subunit SIS2-like n=1 Tax=Cynara cardunculus var. scolymus TaxID=59895 RepID=UPI000D6316BC|nr:phosphopantothenoylcysteine decarboxylase subunit SIS2-like [Cynara cardunculus var. scolymus]
MVQAAVHTYAEAISALTSKVNEANAQLTRQGELMQQILELLQSPVPAPTPSFTVMDHLQLDQTLEHNLLQARALTKLEEMVDILTRTLDNFLDYHADDKVGEIELDVADIPMIQTEANTPRAKANEVEVVDENPTSYEAIEAKVVDETVRADAEARDEVLPITSVDDAGDKEDDDDEDDDNENNDSLTLPDAGKDLGDDDDEDDDDDDFTIQY